MRRITRAIGIAACLSLLLLKLSGAHIHIGAEGYVGAPETSYSHDHREHDRHHEHHASDAAGDHGPLAILASGKDYRDARDVSLLDQSLTSAKIPMAILTLILLFMVLPGARTLASPDVIFPVLSGRHTRWRPPLRAPPQAA